jgi:hypothetical protein
MYGPIVTYAYCAGMAVAAAAVAFLFARLHLCPCRKPVGTSKRGALVACLCALCALVAVCASALLPPSAADAEVECPSKPAGRLPCLLAAAAHGGSRVIITAVSSGATPFVGNLVRSLERVGAAGHLVVFALDAPAAAWAHARGLRCYWDPAPLASFSGGAPLSPGLAALTSARTHLPSTLMHVFGSPSYTILTHQKNAAVSAVVDAGFDALLCVHACARPPNQLRAPRFSTRTAHPFMRVRLHPPPTPLPSALTLTRCGSHTLSRAGSLQEAAP